MTTGFFTSANEPALPLEVRGPDGARSFDAIIDTGFNGALTRHRSPVGLFAAHRVRGRWGRRGRSSTVLLLTGPVRGSTAAAFGTCAALHDAAPVEHHAMSEWRTVMDIAR